MNDREDFDGSDGTGAGNRDARAIDQRIGDDRTIYERIVPRLLRNMAVAGVLLLGPAFWFYRWTGALGFAFGAAVSCVNFRSLTRGIEGVADRIVNRNSREKGGRIILRFVVRYALVGAAAYAIFKCSTLAFRGFLWGLCVPVVALMVEAAWEGYTAIRRAE
jgi:hypothetical protein